MKRYSGTLKSMDLGTGGWILVAEDGSRSQLVGAVPRHLEGHKVVVFGQPSVAQAGFLMAGPVIEVSRVEPAG